jgi:outer membrane protein assembly factor BamB
MHDVATALHRMQFSGARHAPITRNIGTNRHAPWQSWREQKAATMTFGRPAAGLGWQHVLVAVIGWLTISAPLWTNPLAAQEAVALPNVVHVDEADQLTSSLLERAAAQLAAKQWDDAIDAIVQAQENAGDKLFKTDGPRYLPVRDICWQRSAAMPPEGLAIYRKRIDPLARRWYTDGVASRNAELLEKVVDQAFLSSYGDDALLALGEIALEQADYNRARWCWERISPQLRTVEGLPLWRVLVGQKYPDKPAAPVKAATAEMPVAWMAYPDTDLNLADVRARLILVSILEGSDRRARVEFELFRYLHHDAKGHLGGHEVKYVDALSALLDAHPESPSQSRLHETAWPTFAGAFDRNYTASRSLGQIGRGWATPLSGGEKIQASVDVTRVLGLPERRVAEDALSLLSYHPVVANGLVFANNLDEIYAFQLANGEPAWAGDAKKPGRIFNGISEADDAAGSKNDGDERPAPRHAPAQIRAFGAPRFTMTVAGRWLLARMGWPVTGRSNDEALTSNTGYLVCLDLQSQGKLKWKISADEHRDPRWAFEGSPLSDGTNVYIAMRFSDVQPQSHVACFDLRTGALRWRKMVCAADSIAHSANNEEITHNLLTLDHGTLYINTNLGAVAAMDAADGRIRWLYTYPRVERSALMQHAFRDLNPAVLHLGTVLVAPSDCEGILALDASDGQLLWIAGSSPDGASRLDGAVHLLGVSGGNLWASGNLLWQINVDTGKLVGQFPGSREQSMLRGYGRGLLAGNRVYWPARNEAAFQIPSSQRRVPEQPPQPQTDTLRAEIHVFDASSGKEIAPPIKLIDCNPACDGGNLIVADNHLVVATPDHLMAYPLQVDSHTKTDETHTDAVK